MIAAAGRELEEETGYKAASLELIQQFYTSPHFSDEEVYVFIATDLTLGQSSLEEREKISCHLLTESEIEARCMSGEIIDAKTIIAFQNFRRRNKEL